ncbi:hypothetical protein A134_00490 [Vibrio crassostreae 9CS106]|nr:hypothetical protein A134_00490 [Vibrio crassostreae 9CS106]
MRRILVLAYAVSPTRGSEYNVAWNYIRQLAKKNIVDVIYGASGDHIGDTEELEAHLRSNMLENVNFYKAEPDRICNALNFPNKKGVGFFFYLAFHRWHKAAYKKAIQLNREFEYDLTHQLNPIGFREPGLLYRLNLPHVWGPVGGANIVNFDLVKEASCFYKIMYKARNVVNYCQLRFSIKVKRAIKHSDAIIFATKENQAVFNHYHKVEGYYLPEQAVEGFSIMPDKSSLDLKLIFVGGLDKRKNVSFLIDVLAQLKNKVRVSLEVIGDGPELMNIENMAKGLDLSNVYFSGKLDRNMVKEKMRKSDLLCLCSTSEANTTVVFEAFGEYLPTISLELNGMSDTLKDGMGFLVPVSNRHNTVIAYAKKLEEIARDRSLICSVRNNIEQNAYELTWTARGEALDKIYNKVLN